MTRERIPAGELTSEHLGSSLRIADPVKNDSLTGYAVTGTLQRIVHDSEGDGGRPLVTLHLRLRLWDDLTVAVPMPPRAKVELER
jgi:phage head maturation protease